MRRRGGAGGLITGGLRYKNSYLRHRHQVAPRHEFVELLALGHGASDIALSLA